MRTSAFVAAVAAVVLAMALSHPSTWFATGYVGVYNIDNVIAEEAANDNVTQDEVGRRKLDPPPA